jgi:hypothetical protein
MAVNGRGNALMQHHTTATPKRDLDWSGTFVPYLTCPGGGRLNA